MASRVSARIGAEVRKARDTVICEKPLARATSSMVGIRRACHSGSVGAAAFGPPLSGDCAIVEGSSLRGSVPVRDPLGFVDKMPVAMAEQAYSIHFRCSQFEVEHGQILL